MILDKHDRWYDHAKCLGQAPLFDAPTASRGGARSRQDMAAEAERIHRARLICGRCPVQVQCLADAKPVERDEGIRAGIVLPPLKAGRAVPARCGTYTGYQRHLREKTPVCDECRQAFRKSRRELKARKESA